MCRYRIVQDGLPLLLPYVTQQLLQPTVQEFLHLIEGRSLYVPEEARAVPAAGNAAAVDAAVDDAAAGDAAAGDAAAVDDAAASSGVARAGSDADDQDVKQETENQSKQPNAGQPLARLWCVCCELAVHVV